MTAARKLSLTDRAYLEQALRPFFLALKDLNDEAARINAAMNAVSAAYLAGRRSSASVAVDLTTGRVVELPPTEDGPATPVTSDRPAPKKAAR
jgi:hypothetical protein